jgi:PDZ domain
MASPRHLWSGDWRGDSDAVADELARRRGQGPHEPDPEPLPEREPARPTPRTTTSLADTLARARERLAAIARARRRHAGLALLVVLGALILAAVGYGISTIGGSGNSNASAGANTSGNFPVTMTGPAWLGVEVAMPPGGGVIVEKVEPGSPADRAGLEPGDVLMQIGSQPITSPSDVSTAIQGLHPGDHVQVAVLRGASTLTTDAVLTGRPARSP